MLTRSRKNSGQNQQQLIQQENDLRVSKGKKRKYKGLDVECEESGDSYQPTDSSAEQNDDDVVSDGEEIGLMNNDDDDDGDGNDSDFVNAMDKSKNPSISSQKIRTKDADAENANTRNPKKMMKNNSKRRKIRQFYQWKLNSIDDDGILKIFSMFDRNRKGYINCNDVSRIVDELMMGIDYEQQEDMMKRVAEITGGSSSMIEPEQFFTLVNSLRGQQ
eukprot:TRINITY_DN4956_c0_g1_i4.p1 TRINITY_DN4956_c0_g1~~TRINITY_DN4956_c0_g1_i4.p1  ORF type:complete len:218 (+),score=42.37 TRINITY_DN4956_c0_g1_i4:98-751(+)